jgi:hypothetical protein
MALTGSAGAGCYRERFPAQLRLATAAQMEKMVIDGVRNIESIPIPMVLYFYIFADNFLDI